MAGRPVVREVPGLDEAALAALTAGYPFGDYRRVARIPEAGALAYLCGTIAAAARGPRALSLVAEHADGTPAGLLVLRHIESDSEMLGMEVAGIPVLVARADHPAPRTVFDALLAELPQRIAREGYRHVSVRTDTENLPAYHALTDAGFRLMETLVTLSYDTARRGTGRCDPRAFGFDGEVRPYEPRDLDAVRALAATRFLQNRFHRDTELSPRRAGELMARWITSYCEDAADHEVWIAAEAGGGLAGFLGHGLNRELERASGVLVSGRALLAVENPRTRVGQMLSRAHTWQSRGDYKEADTQLDNYGMIKVAFNLDMDLVRTRYTFHRGYGA
ncbi:MAG: hypothetical protein AAF682_28780 [Planctomycetota bacterium]